MAELPFRTRVLYAASSLGSEALSRSRSVWLVYYYAPPEDADLETLLPLGLVGPLIFAGRLIEAFDDALIGYWSDRTRSRLGRRIPFILASTPLWALFAVFLFTPPADSGTALTAAYLLVILELHHLFGTLSGGPYEALLPEIAATSEERVKVVGTRVYLGALGAVIGLAGSGLLVDTVGFAAMAAAMALLALVFRYVGMVAVWRRSARPQPPADISLREAMRATFSNESFVIFLPTFVLFQIGLELLLGVLPYYAEAVLGAEDEGTWVAILTGVAIGSMLSAIPFFAWLARRTSKRQAFSAAMLAAALAFPLVFVAGFLPGIPAEAQIVAAMVVVGAPIAGVYLFPAALTADIVEDDTLRTGFRREATYYGTQNFVEKTATSIAPLLLVLLLLFGRSEEDPLGIRLVGPTAGFVVLLGYLLFRRYRLPDQAFVPVPAERR